MFSWRTTVKLVLSSHPWGMQGWPLKKVLKIKFNLGNDKKAPFYAIIDNFLYKTSLKSTTDFDFERKIWIKFFLKDNSSIYSSSSALSDRSIQVEDNTKRPFRLTQRWLRPLHKGDRLTELKITGKQIRDLRSRIRFDCNFESSKPTFSFVWV